MDKFKKIFPLILAVILALTYAKIAPETEETPIAKDGYYTSKDEVALYLYTYEELPDNYITKQEAIDLGWIAAEGNLWDVTDHMSIGGDRYYNLEGLLPQEDNREYYECDIDYSGGTRNGKRIVYSDDGLIFYTDNHYQTFEQLYGENDD